MKRLVSWMIVMLAFGSVVEAQSLTGSRLSMNRQVEQAKRNDFTRLKNGTEVKKFVDAGRLVKVTGNSNYRVNKVSFPFARPETKLFIERLSAQAPDACGKLVVTSLTRPTSRQPRNASPRSVHPTGMAFDLRVPQSATCRSWLDRTFLSLENKRVIEATREKRPVHYHLSVDPQKYRSHLKLPVQKSSPPKAKKPATKPSRTYTVRKGETLLGIANRHNTTLTKLQTLNNLRGNTIRAGQRLKIPS